MQRFDSEHDNESQTLLRSARNNFYTTYSTNLRQNE